MPLTRGFEMTVGPEDPELGEPGLTREDHRNTDRQAQADSDQTSSDRDQTNADADQTASESDQTSADDDQSSAHSDQVASDREQEVSDRELENLTDLDSIAAHLEGTRVREAGTIARHITTLQRADTDLDRVEAAAERDRTARMRDRASLARDKEAAVRDAKARRAEEVLGEKGPEFRDAIRLLAEIRTRAAEDRRRAAEDRRKAAEDRERARLDRIEARAELERAHLDDLTGAYRRGAGETVIMQEIERARRTSAPLVLAFMDVDDLKRVNGERGHAAGDLMLQNVVLAVRSRTRAYEPIVRLGGDEFICAMSDTDLLTVEKRFVDISEILATGEAPCSMSVGFATLEPDDALPDLVGRADAAMAAVKSRRGKPA